MKIIKCTQCGSTELLGISGYRICKYCHTRYALTQEDVIVKESTISLDNDIKKLLDKCKSDPQHARRYANLILDIDPTNTEVYKYL